MRDDSESINFSELVKSKFFVDKSILVKVLFWELFSPNRTSPVVTVLAPSRYGKTVNNQMVKAFLEIVVNSKGDSRAIRTTRNYKLFKGNNLTICGEKVFKKHFGKHPVIYINCKPLSEATNFNHTVDIYREILRNTFEEHRYLLEVERLWLTHFNKSSFQVYFDTEDDIKLHRYYIFCGFSILATVLEAHFGRPAFVLVDDFDAVEDCPAYATGEDKRRIHNFVKEVSGDFLKDNDSLAGALLVGTLRKRLQQPKKKKGKTTVPPFIETESLWRYYGISEEEVRCIIRRFVKDDIEIESIARRILAGCRGGSEGYQKHQPCSVWHVEQYFVEKQINITIRSVQKKEEEPNRLCL